MTTAAHVVATAQAEVGYVEDGGPDGHSGNITKYWADLDPGLQGQPWCAAFVRWVDKHAGGPILPIDHPYYCPSIVTFARQHGLWNPTAGRAADYVLFDFTGHGVAEHIGRLTADYVAGVAHTVEGNTSPDATGSQANGGGVYHKTRNAPVILGFVRYSTLLDAPPVVHTVRRNPYTAPTANIAAGCKPDKVTHLTRVHWVQWAAGATCDGVFGSVTTHAVRLFQHYHGLRVDGIVGPRTRIALARVTH